MKKRLFRLGALCCVAAMTITTTAQALSVEEALRYFAAQLC